MAVFKSTMIFDGPKHGWTESYAQDLASGNYQTALANLGLLADKRVPLLGKQTKLIGLRVSDISKKNDGNGESRDQPGSSVCDNDEPDACLVCIARDPTFAAHKVTFLRGIPDEIDVQFGKFIDNPCDFQQKFNAYARILNDPLKPWGWFGRPLVGVVKVNVSGYTVLGSGQVQITFAAPLFGLLDIGKRRTIQMSGVNAPARSELTGQVVVEVTSTTVCHTFIPYAVFAYSHGGTAIYAPSTFIKIADFTPNRIGTRRVGAPLLSSRGRQRGRARG